jgi:hypothetical protein
VSAASALLDRGWGKPQQTHTGEDGDIRVIIRTITEGAPPMPSCRVPRPAGSLGGGGVVGVGHGHPHHHRQIVSLLSSTGPHLSRAAKPISSSLASSRRCCSAHGSSV